jgi:hypothetical protein
MAEWKERCLERQLARDWELDLERWTVQSRAQRWAKRSEADWEPYSVPAMESGWAASMEVGSV